MTINCFFKFCKDNNIDIAAVTAVIATIILFTIDKIRERNKINKSIKREIRNGLLKTCDKLHRYSELLIANKLRVNFFERMSNITLGTEQSFEYEKEYNFERSNFNVLNEKWFLQKGDLHAYKYDFDKLKKYDIKTLEDKLTELSLAVK